MLPIRHCPCNIIVCATSLSVQHCPCNKWKACDCSSDLIPFLHTFSSIYRATPSHASLLSTQANVHTLTHPHPRKHSLTHTPTHTYRHTNVHTHTKLTASRTFRCRCSSSEAVHVSIQTAAPQQSCSSHTGPCMNEKLVIDFYPSQPALTCYRQIDFWQLHPRATEKSISDSCRHIIFLTAASTCYRQNDFWQLHPRATDKSITDSCRHINFWQLHPRATERSVSNSCRQINFWQLHPRATDKSISDSCTPVGNCCLRTGPCMRAAHPWQGQVFILHQCSALACYRKHSELWE
jgi:hypothetical protein